MGKFSDMALLWSNQAWCETTSIVGSQKEQIDKVLHQKIAALFHLHKYFVSFSSTGSAENTGKCFEHLFSFV